MAIGNPLEIKGTWTLRKSAHAAHGAVISIAIILWFPLGVFLLRGLSGQRKVRYHVLWQTFGLLLLLVGFGLGAWLSSLQGGLYHQSHLILGTILTGLFLMQPIIGYLHHRDYSSYKYVWLGRVLLVLGVINGGIGLKISENTTSGEIVYGVVAGLMAVTYVGVWWWAKQGNEKHEEEGGEGVKEKNEGRVGSGEGAMTDAT